HAPPELGEHTAQILSRFKTVEELAALKEKGIIDGKIA
ncbi:CoA transferase, partial [Acinetobacter pittii]